MKVKLILWGSLLSLLMITLAWFGQADQAYISIIFPPWNIRFSLIWGCVALILMVLLLDMILGTLWKFLTLPSYFADYIECNREKKAIKQLYQALNFFFSGRFWEANKSLEQAIKYSDSLNNKVKKKKFLMFYIGKKKSSFDDLICSIHLLGAITANSLRKFNERDQRLKRILPEFWQEARFLVTTKLALQNKEIDLADYALRQYFLCGGHACLAHEFAAEIACSRHDWSVMREQAILYERGMSDQYSQGISAIRLKADINLLLENGENIEALLNIWDNFDNNEKFTISLVEQCVVSLTKKKRYAEICDIAESFLYKEFSEKILRFYCSAVSNLDISRAIAYIERMKNRWPEDAEVFYVLGYLCYQEKIWGKAKLFLEKTILSSDITPNLKVRAHCVLVKMFDQLHEAEMSSKHVVLALQEIENLLP